jgi:RNA polymerase sigma-70 factor, ECF subfamily
MTARATFDPRIDGTSRRERDHLLDVAFRMLGDLGLAEDMVQEAFVRLARTDLDTVEDVRGWLVVVTGRLCLDHLRSARVRRESLASLDLDAAAPTTTATAPGVDPADRVTLDDTVRAALLTVLERLTPAERTAFILHDVFQLAFDQIGDIVGRTPTACRRLASRARQRLRAESGPVRMHVEPAEHHRVVEQFIAAASGGDLDALMALLDPDVASDSTPGGVIDAKTGKPAVGREAVARKAVGFLGPHSNTTLVSWSINQQPAIVVTHDGVIIVVVLLTLRDGLIEHVHAVGDPIGLARASDRAIGRRD